MIGDVIRRLRTGLSMTQAELGTRMGVIKQTISNWEKNISTPNIDAIVKLSEIFGVPTDYLLEAGVFENWNQLLANKAKVMEVISSCTSKISKDLQNGTDDITYAKLVYAFNIQFQQRKDGVGITAQDPIPTYPCSIDIECTPKKRDDSHLLHYYNQLNNMDKIWIMGQIVDIIKDYQQGNDDTTPPVAAGESLKEAK